MRDQPTGEQLLETARELLRGEVIPALPGYKRHAALMIANAIAVAAREMRSGDEPERHELQALHQLLALPGDTARDSAGDTTKALSDANRLLCEAIRQGQADAGELRSAVWRHLLRTTSHRVAISNPKYLEARR